MLRDRLRPGR